MNRSAIKAMARMASRHIRQSTCLQYAMAAMLFAALVSALILVSGDSDRWIRLPL